MGFCYVTTASIKIGIELLIPPSTLMSPWIPKWPSTDADIYYSSLKVLIFSASELPNKKKKIRLPKMGEFYVWINSALKAAILNWDKAHIFLQWIYDFVRNRFGLKFIAPLRKSSPIFSSSSMNISLKIRCNLCIINLNRNSIRSPVGIKSKLIMIFLKCHPWQSLISQHCSPNNAIFYSTSFQIDRNNLENPPRKCTWKQFSLDTRNVLTFLQPFSQMYRIGCTL